MWVEISIHFINLWRMSKWIQKRKIIHLLHIQISIDYSMMADNETTVHDCVSEWIDKKKWKVVHIYDITTQHFRLYRKLSEHYFKWSNSHLIYPISNANWFWEITPQKYLLIHICFCGKTRETRIKTNTFVCFLFKKKPIESKKIKK